MEYLIFNEESLPYTSIKDANSYFPEFIAIVDSAIKNQFKAIRLSSKIDNSWFEVELAKEFTLRDWLSTREVDFKRKIKSIISKTLTPQIPEEEVLKAQRFRLSEFYLVEKSEIKTPSLGAAYLLRQLALSLNSQAYWGPPLIKISHEELTEREDFEVDEVEVKNCCFWNDWEKYLHEIEREKQENLRKGNNLWEQREMLFPNIRFVGETPKQLTRLSLNNTNYNQLFSTLKKLNDYCSVHSADFSLQDIIKNSALSISDESESVKQNPRLRALREFKIEDERVFFGYHVKNFSGGLRLHFTPNIDDKVMYIAYFGKHLPLK